MSNFSIIGLYSQAPGSGKTTVAAMLTERGYGIVPFAGTLKSMVVPMLVSLGYDNRRAWEMVLRDKGAMVPEIGVTVRHMLQTLGTEYGRQCLHPDVWLTCWKKQVDGLKKAVADDVRFRNEAQLIRQLGGKVWLVRREGVQAATDHASEGGLDGFMFDDVIDNCGTLDDLRSSVLAALEG
jgi:hypothetical protein